MKITKSQLNKIIKEEIYNVHPELKEKRGGVTETFNPKELRGHFKDLNWFKRFLGFKSDEAKELMDGAQELLDRVNRALSYETSIEELEALQDEMRAIRVPIRALEYLPDNDQNHEGQIVSSAYTRMIIPLRDEVHAAYSRKHGAEQADRLAREKEREARKAEERDQRALNRAKKEVERDEPEEYSKWEGGGMKFRKKGFDQRHGGYRSRSYGSVGVTPPDYSGDLSMDDLSESAIAKLKRIIREEVKKAIK